MKNGVLVILAFSLVKFLVGWRQGFCDWILQELLNVREKSFLIFVSNGRNHLILSAIIFGDNLSRHPKGPSLPLENVGVVTEGTQVEGVWMKTMFVIELEDAFEELDVGDVFPEKLHSTEGQSKLEEDKNKSRHCKKHPNRNLVFCHVVDSRIHHIYVFGDGQHKEIQKDHLNLIYDTHP